MIVQDRFMQDGMEFVKTYSDEGYLIRCNGQVFKEAIDFAFNIDKRQYEEIGIHKEEISVS